MGLTFGSMVLNQPNLIRAKRRTPSSLDPHQKFLGRFNLPLEMGDPRKG
jgi:hypothetical protein